MNIKNLLKNKKALILIAGFLAIAIIFFAIGSCVSKNRNSNRMKNDKFQQQMGLGGPVGGMRNGNFESGFNSGMFSGEILAKDAMSITLKMKNGGSRIIFLSDKTSVSKSTEGTVQDLEVGKTVSINGTPNSDGSVTAQSVEVRNVAVPVQ
ncbi:MAG TPA: DUF5666 domain-containing protein [Candidatus Paceibacterota bacterium]|nr:DUF5666 domain-containing protein [Candidatus Paceibacterota bacterium]